MGVQDRGVERDLRGFPEDEENLAWQDDDPNEEEESEAPGHELDASEAEVDPDESELDWAISQEESENDWD